MRLPLKDIKNIVNINFIILEKLFMLIIFFENLRNR